MMAKVGRPSKYGETTNRLAREWLQDKIDRNEIPFIEDLAVRKFYVSDDTILNWAESHTEFLATYKLIKTFQKLMLKEGGLSGDYKSNVAELLLSADHGVQKVSKTVNTNINQDLTEDEKAALRAIADE